MFKSAWLPLWGRKETKVPEPLPLSFTINNESDVYNVTMNAVANDTGDDFIDISYKKLTYAEVAAMLKHKKQTSRVSKPTENRVFVNQYTVLEHEDEDLEASVQLPERIKTNNYYLKNKIFKEADKKKPKKGRKMT